MTTEVQYAIRTTTGWTANQTAMEALYGVGNYYTTLSAWEAAQQGALTTLDQIHTAVCYNDWPSRLTDSVNVSGSTTDATRYMRITVATGNRWAGTVGSGFGMTSASICVTLTDPYSRAEWVDAVNSSTLFGISLPGANTRAVWCASNNTGSGGGGGFSITGAGALTAFCFGHDSYRGFYVTAAATVENCIAVNCSQRGFWDNGTTAIAENCVAYGNVADWVGTWAAGSTNNAASSGTPPGTNPVSGVTSAAFVNAAGGDYHLTSGSVLRGAGANFYDASIPTDIDGDALPTTGAWDIGFDYYAATASISFSSATTDGADTLAATVGPIVAASSATTDGADVLAASVGPVVGASSATTDGADVLAGAVGPVVSVTSATTDGADVLAASVTVGNVTSVSSSTTDGADVLAAAVGVVVDLSSATTDGADTLAAAVAPIVALSSATTDGADLLAASVAPLSAISFSADLVEGADVLAAQIDSGNSAGGSYGRKRHQIKIGSKVFEGTKEQVEQIARELAEEEARRGVEAAPVIAEVVKPAKKSKPAVMAATPVAEDVRRAYVASIVEMARRLQEEDEEETLIALLA